MSQQNFVEQFRLFMEYARKNSMHSRECMLWISLFYFANEEATYNGDTQTYEWPDDFFAVSNGELNAYGKFDKQAVESLRNRLKQRGLIDFIKGNRNSATPMYKMHYLYKSGNKIIPNNTTNQQANHAPNHTANNTTNQQANHVPNHIIGAETGNRRNKVVPKRDWIMPFVEMCDEQGTPVFMKESLREIMGADFRQEFPWGEV